MDAVQLHSINTVEGLTATIESVRNKKKYINSRLKVLREKMAESESIGNEKLDEYMAQSNELRKIMIYEAEFLYLKNIL
jgi:hypothetical protein